MFKFLALFQFAQKVVDVVKKLKGVTDTISATPAPAIHGNKTYMVATGLVLYAIGGWMAGEHTLQVAVALVMNGLGLASLRHGLKTGLQKLLDLLKPGDGGTPSPTPVPPTPVPSLEETQELHVDDLFRHKAPPSGVAFAQAAIKAGYEKLQRGVRTERSRWEVPVTAADIALARERVAA